MAARTRGSGPAGEDPVGGGPKRAVSFALPGDLGRAVRALDDDSLDCLVKAAVAEARRRGRNAPRVRRSRRQTAAVTPGQERMILAALDAGLNLAAIVREFRLSPDRVNAVVAARRRA